MNAPLEPSPTGAPPPPQDETATGLPVNVSGLLCYLLGFVTGIVFLVVETKNQDVRFHAYQSLATFLSIFVASVLAGIVPLVGWLLSALLTPLALILWVILMLKAAQGERFKLPWVGDWAEQQLGR